jgi:hypothetical protein
VSYARFAALVKERFSKKMSWVHFVVFVLLACCYYLPSHAACAVGSVANLLWLLSD